MRRAKGRRRVYTIAKKNQGKEKKLQKSTTYKNWICDLMHGTKGRENGCKNFQPVRIVKKITKICNRWELSPWPYTRGRPMKMEESTLSQKRTKVKRIEPATSCMERTKKRERVYTPVQKKTRERGNNFVKMRIELTYKGDHKKRKSLHLFLLYKRNTCW